MTVYVANFYYSRRHYPPGPFPLPLLGNILLMKGVNKHLHEIFQDIGKDYKNGIYTFWIGTLPQVVITDPVLALEVLKKHQFAGRPFIPGLVESFAEPGSTDVAFADFGKEWEVLRRVAHSAVRKYAVTDKFARLVSDVTDEVVDNIKNTDGIGKEVDIRKYLTLTMYSILSSATFGQNYKFDSQEVVDGLEALQYIQKNQSILFLIFFIPILKYLFYSKYKKIYEVMDKEHIRFRNAVREHSESLDNENLRDFTDAMLAAKKEAEEESEKNGNRDDLIQYLKPANIENTVGDLFTAGSDTTKHTLLWSFLLMANNPEVQEKIRMEVEEVIGGDVPNLSHKQKCHFTSAFIAETLRFRPVAPTGLPHKATVDTEVGGYKIKKDTTVFPILAIGLQDKNIWNDPEVFRPERFLDTDDKFISKPNAHFIPFSAGRRGCPGEKLAIADIFFFIARFIQQTKGYHIALPGGVGSVDMNGDPYDTNGWVPFDFKIILKEINNN
jgi:cytochrome P450